MDRVRDICYCTNEECNRKCERNTKYHDFRNQIMTLSMFNEIDGWSEENCEEFMEFYPETEERYETFYGY